MNVGKTIERKNLPHSDMNALIVFIVLCGWFGELYAD